MARTKKSQRLYHAAVARNLYERQVLVAIDAISIFRDSWGGTIEALAIKAAVDFNVKLSDIMQQRGRLW